MDIMEETIVKMLFGSHVYGTNTPDSDRDYKTVFVPSARDILMQRATKVSRNSSTGDNGSKNSANDVDSEEFSLHGYMKLLGEGQTVAVDMLFVPSEHILVQSFEWDFILRNRHRLVSRSIAPFVGYCRAQANKYGIKGSRMAAVEIALRELRGARSDWKLEDYDVFLQGLADRTEHIEIVPRTNQNGQTVEHFSVCGKLAPYTLRVDRALAIFENLWNKYGERARQAKDNKGIDWKALMHAVRICEQAIELLESGSITFPRQNADDLLKIRLGERPYAEVAERIEAGMDTLDRRMRTSSLEAQPDKAWMEEIVMGEYRAQVEGWDGR